jgi:hypothetical protein
MEILLASNRNQWTNPVGPLGCFDPSIPVTIDGIGKRAQTGSFLCKKLSFVEERAQPDELFWARSEPICCGLANLLMRTIYVRRPFPRTWQPGAHRLTADRGIQTSEGQ